VVSCRKKLRIRSFSVRGRHDHTLRRDLSAPPSESRWNARRAENTTENSNLSRTDHAGWSDFSLSQQYYPPLCAAREAREWLQGDHCPGPAACTVRTTVAASALIKERYNFEEIRQATFPRRPGCARASFHRRSVHPLSGPKTMSHTPRQSPERSSAWEGLTRAVPASHPSDFCFEGGKGVEVSKRSSSVKNLGVGQGTGKAASYQPHLGRSHVRSRELSVSKWHLGHLHPSKFVSGVASGESMSPKRKIIWMIRSKHVKAI